MESNKSIDFKSNVADLTKIPPNEFEKYFQDWMERDDVARSLQAKLRCDLIKNFNKTNLGKHILSHTMTSGGTTMRLTLSPLVLALNTLVAEFLYSQNCHFTLSVFCTEIPFRNTLPDFETMRRFRFNNEEISEIWQAVTGSKASKTDLNKNIIQNYSANSNISLLLLIIKSLLQKQALDPLKKNAGAQTEIQVKSHKSTSAQDSDRYMKSSKTKDDNLEQINKYLLTLSEKVIQMTKEFEQFAKQSRESRPRASKSSRSREYYTLNKSLERITESMKAMVQAKRKNKRLCNIVESIDNLTQQFGKCAQNFDNVTKFLGAKEKFAMENIRRVQVKLKEKQTETELQEKSYNDWIHEMRHTENGQRFLNRVEISLRKALTKHLDQLQKETDIKMKHLKSLMKLHYQQKLAKHLLQEPKINLEEARRCNDTIEKKLQQFEKKQMELLQKLHESSLELKEAKLQQKQSSTLMEQEIDGKDAKVSFESVLRSADIENHSNRDLKSCELQESQNIDIAPISASRFDENTQREKNFNTTFKTDTTAKENPMELSLMDVSKTQEHILDVAHNIAEKGRSVDQIIYDAKLRIQQLENESNQLEQNFQSYLERRKRSQEQSNRNQNVPKIWPLLKDFYQITSARLRKERNKPAILEKDLEDEEIDKEVQRLKNTLQQLHEQNIDKPRSAKSDTSTSSLEIKNAILEAKLKFFEHENIIRKCKEQDDEIRTGNLLQKHLEKSAKLPDFFNKNFGENLTENNNETDANDREQLEFNLESSLLKINIKDKSINEEYDVRMSPMADPKTQQKEDKSPTNARRELFPKDIGLSDKSASKPTSSDRDLRNYLRYHETLKTHDKNLEHSSKGEKGIQKAKEKNESTSKLIKQSMAKMQQLFEQQSKSQETLREMVNELQQGKTLQREETTSRQYIRPDEIFDKTLATVTTPITPTTSTTKTSEEIEMMNSSCLKRISNTTAPSLLNLSSHSDNSMDSSQQDIEVVGDTLKQVDKEKTASKEFKGLILTESKYQQEVYEIIESSESSELKSLHSPNEKYQKPEFDIQPETGELNDSPKLSELNLYSPGKDKEIGEIFTESNRTFAPISSRPGESFSSRYSSDMEISTGQQNKDAKNLGDDSESDFWA